jgi:hypothetical protein
MTHRGWVPVAVAGWLLMSPPLVKDDKAEGGYRVDETAKIEEWHQVSAHDGATDCERAKAQKVVDAMSSDPRGASGKALSRDPFVEAALGALCVPADYIYGVPGEEEVVGSSRSL